MRKLKVASVALLVVASTGLMFGSMGFSSVAADRGVSVAVANDANALVGYDTDTGDNSVVASEGRVDLVEVTNRLPNDAWVTDVTIESSSDEVRFSEASEPTLGVGEAKMIDATVTCNSSAEANVSVSVTVEAEGVTAAISGATRSFTMRCTDVVTNADAADVGFAGGGNVHFDGWSGGTLNVTYWTESGDGFTEHDPVEVDASQNLKNKIGGGQTGFVAVYVEESDKTYFNPKFLEDGDDPVEGGKQAPN